MEKRYFLKRDLDFKKVYKKRKTFGNRNFTLYMRKNGMDHTRMGFSISKKVGKAVKRNQIKRRLRSLYGQYYDDLVVGYDLILVVKPNVADLSFDELESAFHHILRISNILEGRPHAKEH